MRAVVVLLAGCDVAFNVTGYEAKCDLQSFSNNSSPRAIATAVDFGITEDEDLLVGVNDGSFFQMTGTAVAPVDLGIYPSVAFGLAPEGDRLFLSSVADEPPRIQSEERHRDGTWEVLGHVPAGVYAGTPSALRYGPRRVLVRLSDAAVGIQEYIESDALTWVPAGPVLAIDAAFAPSLSPNALTMVYSGDGGVFARQRDALDEDFGDPVLLLAGDHRAPVLSPRCDSLFVVDDDKDLVGYP
jgi:hypothetical protein